MAAQRSLALFKTPEIYTSIDQVVLESKPQKLEAQLPPSKEIKDLDSKTLAQVWEQMVLPQSLVGAKVRKDGPGQTVVILHDEAQIEEFEAHREELLRFLRQRLENDLLEIRHELEPTSHKLIEITSKDRFALLAQQNPCLMELEKLLGLQIVNNHKQLKVNKDHET